MRKGATQSKPHEFRAACGRIAARAEMNVEVKESRPTNVVNCAAPRTRPSA
ncbi:hypothetical protein G7009_13815 [Pseudomonas capeferrum]|uniref:hypothetical protein n=1 Tax=Pseudomonas capeferrum TaxID=1495066 RepID=UPI0015E2B8C5|nr:hypothetical protein [Pseudomonas capeferrum]MBA1202817.1 hypothetical protein [Pseudomonas capeferrum]